MSGSVILDWLKSEAVHDPTLLLFFFTGERFDERAKRNLFVRRKLPLKDGREKVVPETAVLRKRQIGEISPLRFPASLLRVGCRPLKGLIRLRTHNLTFTKKYSTQLTFAG